VYLVNKLSKEYIQMNYKNFVILCAFVLPFTLRSQNDLSSVMLAKSWQQMSANPALQPKGVVVNLPGIYNNLWTTNVTFNDLFVQQNGSTILDIGNAIGQLEDQNILRENLDIETIGIGFHLGSLGLSIGHRMRFNGIVDYSKNLAKLIWEGNAQFIGQTIDFGPSFDLNAYHEIALGASYQLGDKVRLGGKVKLLSGSSSLNTSSSDLSLTTSDDVYQLEMDANYVVNSAGTLRYDGLRNIGVDLQFGNFSTTSILGKNSGLAFDLGLAVQLGKLQLTASAIDLGAEISWKENVNNYSLEGTYAFEGLDIAQQLLDDEESFGAVIDTIYATYEPTESQNAYSTTVGAKYYFGAQYEVSEEILIGLIGFTDSYQDVNTTALALSASYQLMPLLRVGGFYGLRNERIDNIGANATLSLGPVRLLVATDNIITAFRPKDSNLANFRLGLNLLFGQESESMESGNSNFF
jgi:hypothetical protein